MITLDQLVYGVRMVETSGRADGYSTVNDAGAVGAYQVLKSNVPSWTREALGRAMTWQAFRDSPTAQDTVARYKLSQYMGKYHSAEAAASVWFSGQPNPDSSASDGGNTVRQYVDKVMKWAAGTPSADTGTSPGGRGSTLPTLGRSVFTAQQAGYQAEPKTTAYGTPVNPFKLPGWIASQASEGAGGGTTGTAVQAGLLDDVTGGGVSVPWDGVSTVILSTLFLLGGVGLVVVGLINATGAKAKAEKAATALTPAGAAAGAVKGVTQ